MADNLRDAMDQQYEQLRRTREQAEAAARDAHVAAIERKTVRVRYPASDALKNSENRLSEVLATFDRSDEHDADIPDLIATVDRVAVLLDELRSRLVAPFA